MIMHDYLKGHFGLHSEAFNAGVLVVDVFVVAGFRTTPIALVTVKGFV